MHLILGGYGQGKKAYVRQLLGEEPEWFLFDSGTPLESQWAALEALIAGRSQERRQGRLQARLAVWGLELAYGLWFPGGEEASGGISEGMPLDRPEGSPGDLPESRPGETREAEAGISLASAPAPMPQEPGGKNSDFLEKCLTITRQEPDMLWLAAPQGGGIVPMDKRLRLLRDGWGGVLQSLAAKAERVDRVLCGLGMRIR